MSEPPPPKNEYETTPRYEEMDPCLHILSSYIPYGKVGANYSPVEIWIEQGVIIS